MPSTSIQLLYTVTASLCIVCCYYGSGQLSAVLSKTDIMNGTKVRTPISVSIDNFDNGGTN